MIYAITYEGLHYCMECGYSERGIKYVSEDSAYDEFFKAIKNEIESGPDDPIAGINLCRFKQYEPDNSYILEPVLHFDAGTKLVSVPNMTPRCEIPF
ncbi:MAG: hypothetical protein IH600_02830 [Bacteroidetes bacterium]|nr:hypothetical protein [Bacteroidota bacterium]